MVENADEIEVKLLLSKLKPLYINSWERNNRKWMEGSWNHWCHREWFFLLIRLILSLQLTLWNNQQIMKFSINKGYILRSSPLISKATMKMNGSLKIPWPKIEIFLIFSMMNKNLISLFYVRQNCETAFSIWNILISFLTHFWKVKDLKIQKSVHWFLKCSLFFWRFSYGLDSRKFLPQNMPFSFNSQNFFRETRYFWALDSWKLHLQKFVPLRYR